MPSLLIITQVYPPDPAAVGQHCADVAELMAARGWNVTVLTASRGYDDPSQIYPRRESRRGVAVQRLSLSSFGKQSIPRRLIAQTLFCTQAVWKALWRQPPDVILASTSPPFAGFFAALLARVRKSRLIWWVMDLNPDQMIAAGKLAATSVPARVFDWMNRFTLRRADTVVALDPFMADRLRGKFQRADEIHVLPPWPSIPTGQHAPEPGRAFREQHGLGGRFVVMYSGNHAIQHPLDTLLAAAKRLESNDAIRFVFVGGGAGKRDIDACVRQGSSNVLSLPYQPLDSLAESLSAADLHVVSMGNDMVGIVHPCKVYSAMAVGRPILFLGPVASHVGRIMTAHTIGWSVAHGDVAAACHAILDAFNSSAEARRELGNQAKRAASTIFSRERSLDAFTTQVEALAGDCYASASR